MGKLCDNCIDLTGCDPISTDNILYLGPNLPCSTINTNDDLTTVIQKIDALLCFTPGAQNLQTILLNGNTATDIPIVMQTLADPTLVTTLSFDGIKIEDSSSTLTLTTDSIIFGNNTTTLKLATPSVNAITLLLPDKPAGTYTLATIDEVPVDANLLHKTGDEIKTGNLTVNNIITIGGLPNEYLMADGTTSTIATIIAGILTPNILDGDTTHAPTGDALFDALALKAPLNSPAFTGNPTAPTPAPGDNDDSIATTSFVTDAVGTLDSNVVHLTGNESITQGTKTFSNTLGNAIDVNMSNPTGSGVRIANTGSSNGLEITNTIGFGLRISNTSTGFGATISNNSSGQGLTITNTSSGNAFVVNGTPPATGFNFIGQNNGTATFSVDKLGNITANSFTKSGGLSTQFLKANGSVDGTTYAPDSTVLHITGNESWTGIKSSTNSGATQINGLSLVNTGTGTSRVLNILNQGGGYGVLLDNQGGGTGITLLNQSTGFGVSLDNIGTGVGFSFNNGSSGDSIYMTNQSTGDAIQIQNASTGYGVRVNNIDGGIGIYSNNQAAGIGLLVDNLLAGHGIIANAGPSATGYNFIGRNNGANTFTVDKLGNLISNSYIKQGGTAIQYLMADGSVTTAANITIPATQVTATPHADYLVGANVQLQLDNTETNVVGLYKIDKTDDKTLKQTGRYRPDTDVSVLSISPADTLNITACDNILFVNEILPDSNANKVPDFLKSFGNKSFVANGTNTPLAANTRGIFYVGLNKLGNQVYQTAKIYDQDVAYLARILVSNTAGVYSIVSAKYFPDLANNRINNRDRFVLSSGYIVPSGAASISFGNRGMSYTKNSINYSNNKLDPNYLTIADSVNPTPMSFLFFLPNITSLAVSIATSTVMDPTVWYLASGAAGGGAVNPTHYQVYRLFITVTGTIAIQTKASTSASPDPGVNAIFATREAALAGLTSTVFPEILPAGDSIALGTFYLRAGMAVNGSTMNDPLDFYFRPFNATASSSLVGVTNHDALSGKNDNPAFQHVTTTDITNWNTAYTNRITSLTTTGTSGAATLIANVLNIPIYAPGTGGTGYIQNQNASPQAANMWINGTGRFDTAVRSFDFRTTTSGFITYDADNLGTGTLSIRGGLLGNVMFFNTSGSVGIGTTNPVTNAGYGGLTLNGLNGGIFSMMVNGGESARLATLNTYTTLYTTGSTPLVFGTNAAERMRITEGGNVGIGQPSPGAKLDINFSGASQTAVVLNNIDPSAGSGTIRFVDNNDLKWSIITNPSNDFYIFNEDGAGAGYGLFIQKSTNNVGLGNSSPNEKLTVIGNVLASQFIKNGATSTNILLAGGGDIPQSTFAPASGSGNYIQNQNASAQSANMWINGRIQTDLGSGGLTLGGNSTPDEGFLGYNYTNINGVTSNNQPARDSWRLKFKNGSGTSIFGVDYRLANAGSDAFTNYFAINGNGNVGIGTTNPTAKLTIAGVSAGAAIDINNITASTGKTMRIVSLNTGGLAIEDITSSATRLTVSSGGRVLMNTTTDNGVDALQVNGSINVLTSDARIKGGDSAGRLIIGNDSTTSYAQFGGAGTYNQNIEFVTSTGSINMFTNNTSRLFITNSGNVGIGTTNPLKKLEVNGTGQFLDIIEMTGTGAMGGGAIRFNTDGSPIGLIGSTFKHQGGGSTTDLSNYVYGNNAYSVWTNNVNRFVINGNGNVGIGTTSPYNPLTINRNFTSPNIGDNEVLRLSNENQVLGNGVQIGLSTYASAFFPNVILGSKLVDLGANTKSDFYIATKDSNADVAPTERMRITSVGNVGIGTTNPQSKLEVQYSTSLYDSVKSITLTHAEPTNYSGFIGLRQEGLPNVHLTFGTKNAGVDYLNTLNLSNDRVLIGTTNDNGVDKLQVAGRIKATGLYSDFGDQLNIGNTWITGAQAGTRYWLYNGALSADAIQVFQPTNNIKFGAGGDNGSDKLQVNGSGQFSGVLRTNDNKIILRNDAIENHATNGVDSININYLGYNQTAAHFRNFTVFDGKTNTVAYFEGSTKNSIFYGTVTASGGFFNSDVRLKDVISREGDVVKFKWKDGRDDKTHVGLIAQEVQEYMPDAVQEGQDGMLSVNYIEVLLAKITAMEKEIKELKSKLK